VSAIVSSVLVVPSGESPFARDLGDALGATTAPVDAAPVAHTGVDTGVDRGVDTVVHVCGDDLALAPSRIDVTTPDSWDDRCERLLRTALRTFQAAHGHFAATGGRIVLVTATTGISGAPSLVPFTTAVEGVRAMAKSAARQWGSLGITVNTVLVPLDLLAPAVAELTSFLPPPALGRPSTVADIATAVGAFGGGTTGATVVVDGGSVMAP
jgi:3-oxoacyl-[acyl-carrier protein] reductase